jgi:NAD(P)-dependent dehydrogenase (short-subunit alcohol dehydrogenase family)
MQRITPNTVFLVSGGARGITAQCAAALAAQYRCKFILLGRTAQQAEPAWAHAITDDAALKKAAIADAQSRGEKPTPAAIGKVVNGVKAQREIAETLRDVKQAGGDAIYLSADVTDLAAMRSAIAQHNPFGAITAILHGAGNLADKLIENKTEADFENVYSAKVRGLENLLAVVDPAQLDFLVLFSSVAGFYGNVGQADYAIANEVLNKAAHAFSKQYPACQVLSINWGPWDGGMVTPQLREYFDKLDIRLIPMDVGTHMLVSELYADERLPAQIVIGSAIRPQPTPPTGDLRTHTVRRTMTVRDNPFLGDHVVNNQAVLPMVSAMAWMASACEQIFRGYRYFGFDNYRVLKGIVFDENLASEYLLDIKEISKNADEIVVEALVRSFSADNKPRFHYSAAITLRAHVPEAPVISTESSTPDHAPIQGSTYYSDGTLFHGYSFQGVQQVTHISERGIVMQCQLPVVDSAYQGQFPVQAFNYFMVDIGLQSIGIWSRHFYKMGSLPLRAVKGRQYRDGIAGQTFTVTMQVSAHSPTNVSAHITLHDADGRVYMTIDDLEVTMSQRMNELFLKNKLPETLS